VSPNDKANLSVRQAPVRFYAAWVVTRFLRNHYKETFMLKVGESIPNFSLPSDTAGEVSSQALLGTRYVIFVYPQDDTFG
jgi:hypothetical protein